jgi:uncharacterized protein with HEPN domain
MRREQLYLADMLEACDDLAEFTAGITYDAFLGDKLRMSAVMQQLMVIGEAAARVSDEFRASCPEVEWAAVAGLRNRLVHGYFRVEWDIVWAAATQEAPVLRRQIAEILKRREK